MLLEQMASGALSASLVSSNEAKKVKDIDKDSYEKLVKPPDYMRLPSDDSSSNVVISHKRTLDEISNEPENLALQSTQKKVKDNYDVMKTIDKQSDPHTGEMDLEDLIAPSTVIKTGMKASDFEINRPTDGSGPLMAASCERDEKIQQRIQSPCDVDMQNEIVQKLDCSNSVIDNDSKDDTSLDDAHLGDGSCSDFGRRANRKKGRKSSEESYGPRRELRSSTGRQSTDSASNH